MDLGTAILASAILIVLALIIFVVSKPKMSSNYDIPESCTDKKRLEFMKLIMIVMLFMWSLGGLIAFWAVLQDLTLLTIALDYVQMPVVASIGVYGTKSAVENLKKYSGATMDTIIEKEEDLDE